MNALRSKSAHLESWVTSPRLRLGLPKGETLHINPERRLVDLPVAYLNGKLGKDSRGGTNKLGR